MAAAVVGELVAGNLNVNAPALLDILERLAHASRTEWLFLRELRVGTGSRNSSSQRLDAFALNCLPHLGMKRVCYEVKVSRPDYFHELKHPLKRRIGLRYSNEFYFATPPGLLKPDEIPVECGLMEIGQASRTDRSQMLHQQVRGCYLDPICPDYCRVVVPAPWRDTPGPTWQFAAAMLRNQRRQMEERSLPPPSQQRLTFD